MKILCIEGLFSSNESQRVIFLGRVIVRSGSCRTRQNARRAKSESCRFVKINPTLRKIAKRSVSNNMNGIEGTTLKNEMNACM